MFWSIKPCGEELSNLNSNVFCATSLSTNDFSTLYTTCKYQELEQSEPKSSPQKREITKITNSQNTKGTYGQPSEVPI